VAPPDYWTIRELKILREHKLSDANYYQWKSKYGGMEAADIRRLRELEDENRRLKQVYADLSLENRALKDVIAKKLYCLSRPLDPATKAIILALHVLHGASKLDRVALHE
jgi:putative transposase